LIVAAYLFIQILTRDESIIRQCRDIFCYF